MQLNKLTSMLSIAVTTLALSLPTIHETNAAVLAVDLSSTATNSGTITSGGNTLTFVFDQTQPSGTGVLNSFLRIQKNHNEQGYNTNATKVFDNKGGNFTRDVQFGELQSTDGFYQFVLDIGEPGNNGSLLSLDGLKLFSSTTGGQSSQSVDPNGNANGISGTLLWDMDATVDNYVLLDAKRNGKPGNGVSDMLLKVPKTVFAGQNANNYFVLWSRFGLQANATSGSGSAGTYEEWAFLTASSSSGPNEIPEPMSLLLIGTGLLGFAATRRRRLV